MKCQCRCQLEWTEWRVQDVEGIGRKMKDLMRLGFLSQVGAGVSSEGGGGGGVHDDGEY